MSEQSGFSEAIVRRMRDEVFGMTITDQAWENSKLEWMRGEEVDWLRDQLKDRKKS